jgi:fatty acid desaturase
MNTLYIILIVLGYILMMFPTMVILMKFFGAEDEELLVAIIWPVLWVCLVMFVIPFLTSKYMIPLAKKLVDRWNNKSESD